MSWIDELRGLASLSVLFGHYYWAYSPTLTGTVFDPGVFGVGVFFLISGYLVPVMSRGHSRSPALCFWLKRAFRLLPVYWTALLIAALVYKTGLQHTIRNLTIIHVYFGDTNILSVAWTLQVEIVFYCWIAYSIWAKRLHDIRYLGAATILVSLMAVVFGCARQFSGVRAPLAVPVGLTLMYLGYWMALRRRGLVDPRAFWTFAIVVAGLLIVSFFTGYDRDWGYGETPWRFVFSYGIATAVFCGAVKFDSPRSSVLLWVGSISYPLYLLHQPFQEFFRSELASHSPLLSNTIAFAATVLASFAVHKAIENPLILLSKRIASRFDIGPVAATPV